MRKTVLGAVILVTALLAALAAAVSYSGPRNATASSHREAPLISEDPAADLTDVYAFRSPDKPSTVTLLANVIPGEDPAAGPNWYTFSPNARYNLNVDTNGDIRPDVIYRFQFKTKTGPFFLGDTAQPYTVTRVKGGRTTVVARGKTAPNNIGPRSTPNYRKLAAAAVAKFDGGRSQAFAGPAGRRLLRRHRRDLRPGRDPQGHRQHGRRQGLLRRLCGARVRGAGADRRPRRRRTARSASGPPSTGARSRPAASPRPTRAAGRR